MLPVIGLNWWAILGATIIYFAIGGIWYSPSLFGKQWAKTVGMDMDKKKRPKPSVMASTYFMALINCFILVFVLSILIHVFDAAQVSNAVEIGIMVWLGFVATEKMTNVLFEGKDAKYFMITSMYSFVGIIIAAAMLATWF